MEAMDEMVVSILIAFGTSVLAGIAVTAVWELVKKEKGLKIN